MLDQTMTTGAVFFKVNRLQRFDKYLFQKRSSASASLGYDGARQTRCREAYMAIKAIAMDIDGTLTNDQKVISPRTR